MSVTKSKETRNPSYYLIVIWLALVVTGLFGISWLVAEEKGREISGWEARLSLVAAAGSRAIDTWVDHHTQTLQNLSDNVSLKLYMTELSMAPALPEGSEAEDGEPAQRTFLRNLLISTAREGGFSAAQTESIPANVAPEAGPGIMLLDAAKKPVVATQGIPVLADLPPQIQDFSDPKAKIFVGPFAINGTMRAAIFRLPIYPVQADANDAAPLGYIVAAALLDTDFFAQLKDLVQAEPTSESLLVSYKNGTLTYFSPRQDGVNYIASTGVDLSTSLEAAATQTPGKLLAGIDYRGQKAFAVAHDVASTDWFVIRKLDQNVALADANHRSVWLHISYLLACALITALVTALWRHASALKAQRTTEELRVLGHTIERQEKLLDLIAETTPISAYILDREQRYRYANRKASEDAGMAIEHMLGKPISDVLGKVRAEPIEAGCEMAEKRRAPFSSLLKEDDKGVVTSAVERQHIPLDDVPLIDEDRNIHGVLVIENDITALVQSQEKQQRTLQHLIRSLVTVVDKRDPHASHHSVTVAALAKGVSRAMGLEDNMVQTAETAGRLMNIGKILVPENVLASETLKDSDRKKIRESIMASADFLKEIEFQGPVVETIRQSQEKVDGSGPLGIKGEGILLPARIIGACNALVAMVSERAYRQRKPLSDALKTLLEDADTTYDRRVCAALVHFVENGEGKDILADSLKGSAVA